MTVKDKLKQYEELEKAGTEELLKDTSTAGNTKKEKKKEKSSQAKDVVKELEEKLENAETEAKQNYERLLRVSADLENYKKRSTKELDDFRKFANESLIRDFLSVIDNLERAIQAAKEDQDNQHSLLEGVELTLKEINLILEKYGVSPIESLEQPFDPNFHQAIMQEETEAFDENTVIKEMQKGYLLRDRLLRPAMVVVAKAKPEAQPDNDDVAKN
jgi:molecular chaperone GrpE